jgi:hypothetical protein
MTYPGRIIKMGEANAAIVTAIAQRLGARGIAVTSPPGVFDGALRSSVRLFQSLNRDVAGKPLAVDGEVGPMTWGALFGAASVAAQPAGSGQLALRALAVAVEEIGTMEQPVGSNSGPRVNQYLASTGTPSGNFWCMAFVHFCFRTAAQAMGVANPFPRTAGVLAAWNAAPSMRITKAAALANLSRVGPGAVFILDYGNGHGHTGIVESNTGGALVTIEGNTNPAGSGNGIGVFRLSRRNVANGLMKGFILVP